MATLKLDVNVDVHGDDRLRGIGSTLAGGAVQFAKFAAGAAVGLAAVGGAATKMAADAEVAQAKLEGTFKSMRAASWTTVDALNAQADALMNATAFDDEAIKEAQATLLTFGKVTGDSFERATETALDMSQFFGTDLQSSSVQLGKALNDPIKGLGSLSRIGVQFSDKQKEVITAFVETGDVAAAQGIILDEVGKQVGSAAEDFAGTTSGMMAQVGNQIGEVGESLGAAILPIVKEMLPGVISGLQTFAGWITANLPAIKQVIGTVFEGIGTAISFVFTEVIPRLGQAFSWVATNVFPIFQQAAAGVPGVVDQISSVIGFLATNVFPPLLKAFQTVVGWVRDNWPTISSVMGQVFGAIANAVKVVWPIVARVAEVLFPLVSTAATVLFKALDVTFKLIGGIFEVVGNTVDGVVKGITGAWRTLSLATEVIWNFLGDIIKGAINVVIDLVNGFLGFLNGISFGMGPIDVGPIHIDGFTVDPFNIPLIPRLAEGGIVTSPTIAMIGESGREAVIPLDKLDQLGGRTVNIYVQGDIRDEEELLSLFERSERLNAAMAGG